MVPERLGLEWVDLSVRSRTGHVDIPRLKEGGVTGAFFAAYVPARFAAGGAARKTLELIDLMTPAGKLRPVRALALTVAALVFILAGIDDVKKIDHRAIASELPGEFAARN